MNKKIAIIGGGFTGLAAAYFLNRAGAEVVIYEKNKSLGGLAGGFREPHWKTSLEFFYHHWFTSDAALLQLARDLNLDAKVIFKRPLTVSEKNNGDFSPLDSALSLLRYKDIPFFDRIRMGLALAFLKFTKNWKSLENVTAASWCQKYMGKKGFEAVWKPLLEGKFGKFASQVNMAWLWARIKTRTSQLGTYDGGFQAFIDDIAKYLKEHGVSFQLDCGDLVVSKSSGNWSVRFRNEDFEFNDVIIAASPRAFANVVKVEGISSYLSSFESRRSLAAQVIVFSLNQPLKTPLKAYWYSLKKKADKPFLAIIDHSQFVDASLFGNENLVYIADYVDVASSEWQRDDKMLVELAAQRLKDIDSSFDASSIIKKWVFRESYAQPIPFVNASRSVPPIVVDNGLYHASLAHIYPWDRGTNFAISLGERVANAILKQS